MNNEVVVLGALCRLEFAYYPNNTIAIIAIHVESEEEWCIPTVNYEQFYQGISYHHELGFPALVIKNHSENEGVHDDLVKAGVIISGPYIAGTRGTVITALLTDTWQAIAKEQLSKVKKPMLEEDPSEN